MRYLRTVTVVAGILFMMLMTSIPVSATTDWSEECLVQCITSINGPDRKIWYNEFPTNYPPTAEMGWWTWWSPDDIGMTIKIIMGNEHVVIDEFRFWYNITFIIGMWMGPDESEMSIVVNDLPYSDEVYQHDQEYTIFEGFCEAEQDETVETDISLVIYDIVHYTAITLYFEYYVEEHNPDWKPHTAGDSTFLWAMPYE